MTRAILPERRPVARQLDMLSLDSPVPRQPVLAAWGAGVNSTAMVIELAERGEPPDAVLLAEMP